MVAVLVAAEGGLALTQSTPEWPAFKDKTVFGQLPHLEGPEGLQVSQSAAIVRVLARKAGLEGKSEADYAVSEMLLEEYSDLLTSLGKCMYPAEGASKRPELFTAFFAPGGGSSKHLGHFEKLIGASGSFTATPTSGELAVCAAISILADLEPVAQLLAGTPKLAAFWASREAATAKALTGLNAYYTRSGSAE